MLTTCKCLHLQLMSKNQKYGNFRPPKSPKRKPLTRQDSRKLYQTACEWPDKEGELVVRTLLDYGLRIDELAHLREGWVGSEYKREQDSTLWYIQIPKFEQCYGGTGEAGQANQQGANLHNTDSECRNCRDRGWKKKVRPKIDGERKPEFGWLTEEDAKKYPFHPKTGRSATKVWELPNVPETRETAKELKKFVAAQKHEQWPHGTNAIRSRLYNIADDADLSLPDRPSEAGIVPHALRHTYGCRLVEARLGEGIGMKQMRHTNSDVFEWYADVRNVRVVNALAEATSESDSLLHEP